MLEKLLNGFRALPPARQILVVLILSGAIGAIVAGYIWSQEPDMQVLFSHLSAEDSGAIIAKLKEQKISYSVEGNGATVMVPSDKVHELRMQLASQSLPQGGGVGFEIFDRTTVGMTDFVQKLNYRRALQGELARTIGQLAEVERVVGRGKAVVRVSSVLDLRKVERTEEVYDPNVQVVRSENRSQEKTNAREETEGGIAGTTSNLPDKKTTETTGGSTNSAVRTNATINYEINKSVSRIIEPVGTIKRLSAAVLVDGSYVVSEAKDGKVNRKYIARGDEEMKKLEDLVKKAV